jgi:hypothetical protein
MDFLPFLIKQSKGINIRKMVLGAMARSEIYNAFHLYE